MTSLALRFGVIIALPMAACQAPAREMSSPMHLDTKATTPSAAANHQHSDLQSVASVAEQAEVDGVSLALRGCQLAIRTDTGTEIKTIDLPEPCKLGRKPDGSVQVLDTKQGATVLVISSRPRAETAGDCDTRKRALVVDRARVKISTKEKRSASYAEAGLCLNERGAKRLPVAKPAEPLRASAATRVLRRGRDLPQRARSEATARCQIR
jgi:hypothetical protein